MTTSSTVLTFSLDKCLYGLPISLVKEACRDFAVSKVFHAHPGIIGVSRLRGQLFALLNLHFFLNKPETVRGKSLLLLKPDPLHEFGLIVDDYGEIATLDVINSDLTDHELILGVGELRRKRVLILDEKVLHETLSSLL